MLSDEIRKDLEDLEKNPHLLFPYHILFENQVVVYHKVKNQNLKVTELLDVVH